MKIMNAVKNKDEHNILLDAAMSSSITAMEAKLKKVDTNPAKLDALLDLSFIAIHNINKEIKSSCILNSSIWIQHLHDYLCIPLNKDKSNTIYFILNSKTKMYDGYIYDESKYENICMDIKNPNDKKLLSNPFIKFKSIKVGEMPTTWEENIKYVYKKYNITLQLKDVEYLDKNIIWPISKIIKKYYKNLGYKVKLKKKSWDSWDECFIIDPSMIISWKGAK